MYDQLLWRIRESLWNICRLVNKSVNYWTCQNVPRPKNTLFGSGIWEIWKPGSIFWKVWKYHKDVHDNFVQNGCDTFPNELMRFHIEAKPIWEKMQKHCKNVVICKMWLWLVMSEIMKKPYFLKNPCFGPSRKWTFPVTVMVLLKTGPPRSLLWSF